jgi:hypothetical protein
MMPPAFPSNVTPDPVADSPNARSAPVVLQTLGRIVERSFPPVTVSLRQGYNLGNPLSLTLGARVGMKAISWTLWVLGALMVMASLDTLPDPPAVNPQAVNVISHQRARPDRFCEHLTCESSRTSSHLQTRWVAFTSAYEPNRPCDRIALTRYAADPSPPALEARCKLHFQS